MRSLIIAAAALGLLGTPIAATAAAKAGNDRMSTCAAAWKAMSAAEKAGKSYKDYSAACLKSTAPAAAPAAAAKPAVAAAKPAATAASAPAAKPVVAPASASAAKPAMAAKVTKTKSGAKAAGGLPTVRPPGATAQCKDNTYSSAKSHSGACAGHGGVATWL